MFHTLNHDLFLAMNAPLGLSGFRLHAAIFAAKDLIYLIPVILAGLWLWGSLEKRQTVLLAVISSILALLISALIGHLWFEPRPFALGLGHMYLNHVPDSSFPSDHTTFLAAVSFTFLLQRGTRCLGCLFMIMTLLVGWARIYVGIHFPLDILGGLVLGFLSAIVILPCKKIIARVLLSPLLWIYRKLFAIPIRLHWIKN